MAAIFYIPTDNPQGSNKTIFRSGFQVNTAIRIPFLNNLVGTNIGYAIITDVTIQNRDTIQYFLTFDDFISYFYFGKGLGTISINGMLFSDCNAFFPGINTFHNIIANVRGTVQNVSCGNAVFSGVVSSFTIRAAADQGSSNFMEFNIQMDVIDHSLVPPRFTPSC